MREILFRGKRVDNGEWVYGDIIQNDDCMKIREQEKEVKAIAKSCAVIPETVGQYTGLRDKNGRRIFEGDILKDMQGRTSEVIWDNDNARFIGKHKVPRGDTYICYVGREPGQEIIGTVWDKEG